MPNAQRFMVFVMSLMLPMVAGAWGSLGHRATGYVAEAFLSPNSQRAVQAILRGQRLADASTWADSLRPDPAFGHISYYHFEKMPDRFGYIQTIQALPPDQRAKGGIMQAILLSERQLEDPRTSPAQVEAALKFLVHFIGDIHQPLHSGRPEDRGGNTIPVRWDNRDSNLHSVWDTGLILTGHADLFAGQPANADYSIIYARWILENIRVQPPQNTRDNPEAWLMESMSIRDRAYDPLIVKDPKRYEQANLAYVDLRVYLAGLRMADTLNRIFARVPAPTAQSTLTRQLEAIVGRLQDLITLGPRATPPAGRQNDLIP